MTGPANTDAAHAPHEADETAPRDRGHDTRSTIMTERDLAALEAQLVSDLQDAQSPAITGPDDGDAWSREDAAPPLRHAPPMQPHPPDWEIDTPPPLSRTSGRGALAERRERSRDGVSRRADVHQGKRLEEFLLELKELSAEMESAPARRAGRRKPAFGEDRTRNARRTRISPGAHDPGEHAPLDWRTRALQPEPAPWLERPERAARLTRAIRVAAAVFSFVAVVGITAVVSALVIGSELPTNVAALIAAPSEQSPAVASKAPAQSQQTEAPAVTGSIGGKRDASRIPAEESTSAALGGGSVRPVDVRAAALDAQAPAASAPPRDSGVPVAQSDAQAALDSPPQTNEGVAPTETQFAPATGAPTAVAASSATETAAQTEARVVAPGDDGAQAKAQPGKPKSAAPEPAPAKRSAAVTEHVNMRSGPNNDASVVAVVPAGQKVQVVDCTRWCEVVYEGRQGFIHRRFVSGAGG